MKRWQCLRLAPLGALFAVATGCHDLFDGVFSYVCEAPSPATLALPDRLSETGLYSGRPGESLAEGVLSFRPAFELWSDGAAKRRWVWLPPGSAIDSADPDDWLFPEGTRVWKEFSRGGVRVETRLLVKVGPGDDAWAAQSYLWEEDDDAMAVPAGYIDALGTSHDVPAASECAGCHAGRRSFVLGLSAIQLARDGGPDEVDLDDLAAAGLLSHVPDRPRVPGDDRARAALGYLHANCGHCHAAGSRRDRPCYTPDNGLDFWLRVDQLSSVEDTPTYTSAVGEGIDPGDPEGSQVVQRMATRGLFERMPPLGTREVDAEGLADVRRWIAELPR